jgi:hypothetical protein
MHYDIRIYEIVKDLWRWEIRSEGKLLRCGTAENKAAAESEAAQEIEV